ncbi:MAG TPA: DUF72 domain-containing protein [Candidatus Thiothrix moscowensis]|uniref:DUF72 domain-containing protein n=1 Tax=unclassified Thiothrix TaxID=2636184 RepID=UPI0025DF45D5|nr:MULTISPECIES: DUF72 domain-containing protein [unclassified Thiothrix]HRJ51609.1 DUF72 domain-containing protein [Candidatus Thiothrix moscowensis]HRJ91924.1 DUF72 domain-containing protein [Candidatus Thiothrix moscowensis]
MNPLPYYLGLPLWANAHWKGSLFRADARPAEFLAQYARVFNAVEGNTTFYSTPSSEMVLRWMAATPDTFRFSCKFPRAITHQHHLIHARKEALEFLQRMEPLGQRLNGLMIQLPASFSPDELPMLETFLRDLPADYQYAVEVRHPAFFTDTPVRATYNALLEKLGVDRVIFESRPLHAALPMDEATREAQTRKPRLPVQLDATAERPVLRYIGHPVLADNHAWLDRWVAQTARWIREGKRPRIFLHTPDNQLAPELALMFHQQLQEKLPGLADLPAFATEIGQASLL